MPKEKDQLIELLRDLSRDIYHPVAFRIYVMLFRKVLFRLFNPFIVNGERTKHIRNFTALWATINCNYRLNKKIIFEYEVLKHIFLCSDNTPFARTSVLRTESAYLWPRYTMTFISQIFFDCVSFIYWTCNANSNTDLMRYALFVSSAFSCVPPIPVTNF